ncbi:molting protein mlt-4 [Anaeramoeba flamelloides]|uniref:Molting protein mlt-4 n=1 Tax=Anaeramoeba flamelloides TaxID=1746091 RepID=A0ABQ8YWX5_9EUKA|nr:molting protein mlt-4 [Anaeramoeba flamelloides]
MNTNTNDQEIDTENENYSSFLQEDSIFSFPKTKGLYVYTLNSEGDCIAIAYDNYRIIIDLGSCTCDITNQLKRFYLGPKSKEHDKKLHIDALFISHQHEDHIGPLTLQELSTRFFNNFDIETVFYSFDGEYPYTRIFSKGKPLYPMVYTGKWVDLLFDETSTLCSFFVVGPTKSIMDTVNTNYFYSDENEKRWSGYKGAFLNQSSLSVILRFRQKEKNRYFLFSGDAFITKKMYGRIKTAFDKEVIPEFEVIKIPHHGSYSVPKCKNDILEILELDEESNENINNKLAVFGNQLWDLICPNDKFEEIQITEEIINSEYDTNEEEHLQMLKEIHYQLHNNFNDPKNFWLKSEMFKKKILKQIYNYSITHPVKPKSLSKTMKRKTLYFVKDGLVRLLNTETLHHHLFLIPCKFLILTFKKNPKSFMPSEHFLTFLISIKGNKKIIFHHKLFPKKLNLKISNHLILNETWNDDLLFNLCTLQTKISNDRWKQFNFINKLKNNNKLVKNEKEKEKEKAKSGKNQMSITNKLKLTNINQIIKNEGMITRKTINNLINLCKSDKIEMGLLQKELKNEVIKNEINYQDVNYGKNLLMHVCQNPKVTDGMVNLLIKNGINPNVKDNKDKTALMYYCKNPKITKKSLTLLINQEKLVNQYNILSSKNGSNMTSMYNLSTNSVIPNEILNLIIQQKNSNSLDILNKDFNNALLYLCQNQQMTSNLLSELIPKKLIDTTLQNNNGKTVLMYLCQNEKVTLNLIKHLIENYQNNCNLINHKNGKTALMYLCENKNTSNKIIEYLINVGNADSNIINHKTGKSALMYLCENETLIKKKNIFQSLIKLSDINLINPTDRKNALIYLLQNKELKGIDLLKIFIDKKININFNDNKGKTTLMYLCENINTSSQMLKLFLENVEPENFLKQNILGETALMLLCQNENITIDMLQLFVNYKKEIVDYTTISGKTALMYLCENKNINLDLLKLLISNSTDANVMDINNYNALLCLCENVNVTIDLIKVLFAVKAKTPLHVSKPFSYTPLMAILKNPSVQLPMIKQLIKLLKDPNFTDKNKKTCLMYLLRNQSLTLQMVNFLINKGVNPNLLDKNNNNSLHIFIKHSSSWDRTLVKNITLSLIENGANSYQKNKSRKYPIDYLIDDDDENEIIKQILKIDSDCFTNDFAELYKQRKKFADKEILKIKVHSQLLKLRTNKSFDECDNILKKYTKNIVQDFVTWLYYDEVPKLLFNDIQENIQNYDLLMQVFAEFDIDLQKKTFSLKQNIIQLLADEDSKDFIIKIKDSQDQIKVHKFILLCRSKFFHKLILNNKDPKCNFVTDESGKSLKALQVLVKYLYTNSIKKGDLNKTIKTELQDAVKYYQLSANCSFDYYLNN